MSVLRVCVCVFFLYFVAEKKKQYKYQVLEERAVVKLKPFQLCNYSIRAVYLHQKCI